MTLITWRAVSLVSFFALGPGLMVTPGCSTLGSDCTDERCWEDAAAGGSGQTGQGGQAGQGGGGQAGGAAACTPGVSPADGGCVDSDNGVFVANEGSDNASGQMDAPVETLARAFELANEQDKAIFLCSQTVPLAVQVPAGTTIYGGLDCANGWSYVATGTLITAPAGEIPLTLSPWQGDPANEPTTFLEDITAQAADAVAPGDSSIAAMAAGTTAVLTRCTLVAGEGAAGAAGSGSPTPNAADGSIGNSGANANCSGTNTVGGSSNANPSCPTSSGGVDSTLSPAMRLKLQSL